MAVWAILIGFGISEFVYMRWRKRCANRAWDAMRPGEQFFFSSILRKRI